MALICTSVRIILLCHLRHKDTILVKKYSSEKPLELEALGLSHGIQKHSFL